MTRGSVLSVTRVFVLDAGLVHAVPQVVRHRAGALTGVVVVDLLDQALQLLVVRGIGSLLKFLYFGLEVFQMLFFAFSERSLGRAILGFPLLCLLSVGLT